MNNGFGFGFSFPSNGDDDNDGEGRNQNPLGGFGFSGTGGGLGDMLNQFGAMLSGMGSSMNSPENSGPVNYDMAQRIANQKLGSVAKVNNADCTAVEDAVRLATLWLDDATALPTASGPVKAWNSMEWLEGTLPMWKRLVTPVAEHMNSAQLESLPEEGREMMGPMIQMMQQFSGVNQGMQLGGALGDLAEQALTGADFGLPVSPAGTTALVPANIRTIAKDLAVPEQEIMVYIAARESARQRLFSHVPWLVERIVSSVEEYAIGLVIDTSHIEEVTRELNLDSGDPQAIQEAMSKLQGMDLTPRITSRNASATTRLETLLALVEGWVDLVVHEGLKEHIPSAGALTQAWARRIASGGCAEHALSKVVGIEINAPQIAKAAELWRRATVAVGADKRDKSWEHPDFLPTAEHLHNPAAFIDSLLDDAPSDGFEAEFAELEKMLQDSDGAQADKNTEDDQGTDAQHGNEKNKPEQD